MSHTGARRASALPPPPLSRRRVTEADHAEDDRLAGEIGEDAQVQPGLRGVDGDLPGDGIGKLGEERVSRWVPDYLRGRPASVTGRSRQGRGEPPPEGGHVDCNQFTLTLAVAQVEAMVARARDASAEALVNNAGILWRRAT